MTIDITNEQLLKDIKNTEIEKDAYGKIQFGFLALSKLPENYGIASHKYFQRHEEYLDLESRCSNFLDQLLILKLNRKLK